MRRFRALRGSDRSRRLPLVSSHVEDFVLWELEMNRRLVAAPLTEDVSPPGLAAAETLAPGPDFEFHFGRDKWMKGRGLKGLVALALVLTTAIVLSVPGKEIVGKLASWAMFLFP